MQLLYVLWLMTYMLAGMLLQAQPCNYIIQPPATPGTTTILDPYTLPGIQPGDIICLEAGHYYQILVRNLQGEKDMPIILRNQSGRSEIRNQAHYGISVRNTRHFVVAGNGDPEQEYGLAVMEVAGGAGISFDQLSSNISLVHTEIAHTLFAGVIAKTDPDCSFASLRGQFTMQDVTIAHNYIHDTGLEGVYAGHSFYGGFRMQCNGSDTLVLPHVIEGIAVHNNRLERTGRNGIMVNSATKNCHIFDNVINADSQAETHNQMGGIQIGGGSTCDCFNNTISGGKGSGIEIFGQGEMRIFNNLIEFAGKSFKPDEPHFQYPKHGIYVRDSQANAPTNLLIAHNTIINPKSDGISFASQQAHGSRIHNNIITGPGSFQQIQSAAFIHHPGISLRVSHNLMLNSALQAGFTDYEQGNYTLKWFSPAVDSGLDLGDEGIRFDIHYAPRPMGSGYDMGAFEADPKNMTGELSFIQAYPNPFSDKLTISMYLPDTGILAFNLYNINGQRVYSSKHEQIGAGSHEITIDTSDLKQGIYFLQLFTESGNPVIRTLRL